MTKPYLARSPHSQPHRTAASDPETDPFELFYWSNVKGRWITFAMLESAHEIVESDLMFRIPRDR